MILASTVSLDLSSPTAFLVVCGLALVDGVVPLVPARTAVIGLGVIAAGGDERAYPLLAVATVAAFVSDNISYWIGARYWSRISAVIFRGSRPRRIWAWVERQMHQQGTFLVAVARVIPGGPTPITLTAGLVGMPKRRFRAAAAVSAALWSAYAFGVGMFGDTLTGDDPLAALLAALAVAAAVNMVMRLLLRRRASTADGSDRDRSPAQRGRP